MCVAFVTLVGIGRARAASIVLAWDADRTGSTAGYVVSYGTASHTYTTSIDVGNRNRIQIPGLNPSTTYYLAVRSYGAGHSALSAYSTEVSGLPSAMNSDFNGDGFGDLIWANNDGTLAATFLNSGNLVTASVLSPSAFGDMNRHVVGTADFDGDGSPDIVWQNAATGEVGVRFMSGATMTSETILGFVPPEPSWNVVAVADFDGDRHPDLLWRNAKTGELGVTFMNGMTLRSVSMLNPSVIADLTWKVVGVADFNDDGQRDILWWNKRSGQIGVTFMNGVNLVSASMLSPSAVTDLTWRPVAIVDLDGDGYPDIVWQNVSGSIGAWFMKGLTMQSQRLIGPTVVPAGWKVAP